MERWAGEERGALTKSVKRLQACGEAFLFGKRGLIQAMVVEAIHRSMHNAQCAISQPCKGKLVLGFDIEMDKYVTANDQNSLQRLQNSISKMTAMLPRNKLPRRADFKRPAPVPPRPLPACPLAFDVTKAPGNQNKKAQFSPIIQRWGRVQDGLDMSDKSNFTSIDQPSSRSQYIAR